jgi:hypothetical protein
MSDSENTIQPKPDASQADLAEEVRHLHGLFVKTLFILLIFSGSMNLFLLRQFISVRKDSAGLQAVVDNYVKAEEPAIRKMVVALQGYAKTHPEFPVLARYGAMPAPASSPIPATSPMK